ncbi:DUF3084 domain-containing protein [Myxosarcina sp. GI1(2024)]
MTSGYILIAAIFVLGGLIAALGDRLGTKVGKARLRLFNLRPRQTAGMVTVITGMLISASTLGILFGLSESLRKGIFQLDDILQELRQTKKELAIADREKQQVASELMTVKRQQIAATKKLNAINQDFQQSKLQLAAISERAAKLRSELNTLLDERAKQLEQLEQLKQKSQQLQSQLQQREREIVARDRTLDEKETRLQQLEKQQQVLQTQIRQRDNSISELDRKIALKDRDLATRTERLNELESQLEFLEREVAILEQYYRNYQELRERQIAIFRGQVLASATVRVVDPDAALLAIDRLLQEANSEAIEAAMLSDSTEQRIVKITNAQVEQLAAEIKDGRDYVLRILSAGNYVRGEKEIRVFADLVPNKKIFQAGEEIATVSIDSDNITSSEVQDRLDWLLSASKFRAQRAGVLGDIQVGDGQIATLVRFVDRIAQTKESLGEIRAIVAEPAYTAQTLKLNLEVVQNGRVVFKI